MTIQKAVELISGLAGRWRRGLITQWDFEAETRAILAQVVMAEDARRAKRA